VQGGVRQRQPLEQSEVVLRGGPCPTPPSPPGLAPLGRQLVAPIGKLFKAEIASEVLARSILVGIPLLTL
jgi:hypothetical protein